MVLRQQRSGLARAVPLVGSAAVALLVAAWAPMAASAAAAPQAAAVSQVEAAPQGASGIADSEQRALPLEGGVNFRDLGGYPTADGRRVRWGLLYRSGSMAGLTDADYAYLKKLNIKAVADFRSTEERLREPTRWPTDGNEPRRLQRDYSLELGELMAVMREAPSAAAAKIAFASFYRRLPEQFAAQYREMFAEMLAGNSPLAFNCSAGKDRTGVAAALILTALGVSRDVVTSDYLLSNRFYKPKPPTAEAANDPTAQMFSRMPPDIVQVFMGVDGSYLDAAFAGMAERYGSVDNYLEQAMGLTATDRAKLRELYTEPPSPHCRACDLKSETTK